MKRLIIILLLLTSSFHCVSQNTDYYDIAYSKIETMLKENSNSFKDAVFTVENAYFDNQLDLDFYYKKIEKYADFCVGIKESGNIIYGGKDQDKALMQYAVFAFFAEKIPILNDDKIDTVYPFKYNYADFAGKNDWSNMFVSKSMLTKQGNCHSLPYLYKIIMDELGEKSYLSLCPNHLYIKAQNEKMGWYNIELTNSNFPTDAYLMSSGYVHIDAIRNGIYMKALTQQESIALCLIDLAQGHLAKFGVGDGEFALKCCETALKYFPDCITAMLLKSRILAEKCVNNNEYFAELTELTTKIHNLGYRKMPERMYKNWLDRVQSEEEVKDFYGLKGANLTAAQANTKNPFADYGLDKSKMIRTAAETVFEEFFDLEDTVELGSVYFNIRTNNITGFIPAEKLKNEIAVDLIAISIDPKAELYWWISPYHYCYNNPINYIDPTGEGPELAAIIPIVYVAVEIGLSIYDAYEAVYTIADKNASVAQKVAAGGGFLLGLCMPGGGYSKVLKEGVKLAEPVMKAFAKNFDNIATRLTKGSGGQKLAEKLMKYSKDGKLPTPNNPATQDQFQRIRGTNDFKHKETGARYNTSDTKHNRAQEPEYKIFPEGTTDFKKSNDRITTTLDGEVIRH